MTTRRGAIAAGMMSVAAAGLMFLMPVSSGPAMAADIESTTDVAKVEAATKYAADWLNGRLKDSDYNLPEITYKGDPLTLRWSHHVPAISGMAKSVYKPGFRLLEKLSKGKIKVEERWGKTIHPANAGYDATRSGLTDMTACYAFYNPTTFDLMHVMSLPGIVPSSPAGTRITQEAYDEFFRKEMERTGVLMSIVYTTTPYVLHSKDVLDSLESLKGKKVRTGGGVHAAVWKALGTVPTTMPAPRIYTAFQRGLLDAVAFPDSVSILFRINELQKSHTYINLSRINQEHCVSRKWFEALPPDLKQVVSRWVQGFAQAISQQFYVLAGAKARNKFREGGINMVQLSDAEKKKWQAAARPVINDWIKTNEAKGLPAKKLIDFIRERAEKYEKMTPGQIMRLTVEKPVSKFIGG
ncbi:MAG: TRAP transporter substrate-binding protein DctP [Betaproteobacteria bacterium]|nr:TRAP transporter substrate-binding protein DctP [Betaproteobacteria bacterium]